jgi:hypothetical protein
MSFLYLPLVARGADSFSSGNWARPTIGAVLGMYRTYLVEAAVPLVALVAARSLPPFFSGLNLKPESLGNRTVRFPTRLPPGSGHCCFRSWGMRWRPSTPG